jgi:hypothetical protein
VGTFGLLTRIFLSCFLVYFQVTVLPKVAAEDMIIKTTNTMGEQKLVVAPAGTIVSLHVPGLHYNREHAFLDAFDC